MNYSSVQKPSQEKKKMNGKETIRKCQNVVYPVRAKPLWATAKWQGRAVLKQ